MLSIIMHMFSYVHWFEFGIRTKPIEKREED